LQRTRHASLILQQLRWALIIAALMLFCCNTLSADVPRTPETPRAKELKSPATVEPVAEAEPTKPDSPTPKMTASSKSGFEFRTSGEASMPGSQPILYAPVKPATTEPYETPRKRKIWYGLMAASHGAAVLDAWTTRRAISGGYGVEGDPLERPFAHSGAVYASTQVTPLLMDYLGRRMMRSEHPLLRKTWWIPQTVCASFSLGAAVHNYGIVP
jgi:hypothetical protein